MSHDAPQSYAKHARYVPMYHFAASSLLLLNQGYAIYRVIREVSFERVVYALTAFALLLLFFYARAFATGNQDRIIRLEERLRLERLLPETLRDRIGEFSLSQLVALRFASDTELPTLAQQVLAERIESPARIKKLIKEWRADHCRV